VLIPLGAARDGAFREGSFPEIKLVAPLLSRLVALGQSEDEVSGGSPE
jgi:hypothetical protein